MTTEQPEQETPVMRPLVEQLIEAIKKNENNAKTRLLEALGFGNRAEEAS